MRYIDLRLTYLLTARDLRCYAEFYVRKIPRIRIGSALLERAVVLKWFYSLSCQKTFVGGKCALPSALLVINCYSNLRHCNCSQCQNRCPDISGFGSCRVPTFHWWNYMSFPWPQLLSKPGNSFLKFHDSPVCVGTLMITNIRMWK